MSGNLEVLSQSVRFGGAKEVIAAVSDLTPGISSPKRTKVVIKRFDVSQSIAGYRLQRDGKRLSIVSTSSVDVRVAQTR